MITINLTKPYKLNAYPCGQKAYGEDKTSMGSVNIISRLSNFDDLQILASTVAYARFCGATKINLTLPYIMGLRSDRPFDNQSYNYLKDVIGKMLNALNVDLIKTLEAHSEVALAYINNLHSNNTPQVDLSDYDVIISPDAGRLKHNQEIALANNKELFCMIKTRTKEGISYLRLADFEYEKLVGKRCIVLDDLCDGGGTFLALADELKYYKYLELSLYITHGLFTQGTEELLQVYDKIYTTNSYKEITATDRIIVTDVYNPNN
jgi:ribose-phosphate pyrophosphokinase